MVSDTLVAVILSAYLNVVGDHAALYQGRLDPGFDQKAWITHPYWQDAEFHEGSISFNGTLYHSVPIRYNIYDNLLCVATPVSNLAVIPERDQIDYMVMDGRRYESVDGHFDCVEYEGQNLKLMHHREKRRAVEVIIENHAYRSLDTFDAYYLLTAQGERHEVSSRKSLTRMFPQWRSEIRHLCRQEELSFAPLTRLEALRRCMALIDGLMGEAVAPLEQQAVGAHSSQQSSVIGTQTVSAPSAPASNARATATAIPDSIYIDLPRVSSVPAFHAYIPERKAMVDETDDEVLLEGSPGIAALDPLRETRTLGEVEVVGLKQKLSQQMSGMESFRPSLLRNVPLAVGEADVLKLALTLPGVNSTGDASSGLNVRGGASDQNLLLLNGNTVFNPMHLFGLFSAFNPDLVAESELYKGGIPSQYGGRLSSVMNIKGRTADKEHFHGSASIGLVTAKAMADIPVIKGRTSLLLGGRTTYSDWMLKKLPAESGYRNGKAGFWDLGGTLHTQINANHAFGLNVYYSHDRFAFTELNDYEYSNLNFSAEMRSRFKSGLQTTVTAGFDHYEYGNEDCENSYSASRLTFRLNQAFMKGVASYQPTDEHTLNFGMQAQLYDLMPGSLQPKGEDSYIVGRSLPTSQALETALWAEDSWTLSPQLKLMGGMRMNLFRAAASEQTEAKVYASPDLRLSASYQFTDQQSVKAGLQTLHQYIHKVSNTVIMSPTDTWVLSDQNIRPQWGWQVSAGYYWQSADKVYECSAEAYYKGMTDYLTYRSAAQLVMNEALHKDVVGTQGRAYGLELQLRKQYGSLNGWISYTYARTQLRQKMGADGVAINRGQWFAADYDSPHQLKLVGNFKFTRRYSMSVNADYSTGRPFTAPVGQFYDEEHYRVIPIYSDRNACRMPDYCRVDWSFNVEPSHHLTALTHSWFTLGVYNLLGRKNAYSIYYKSEGGDIQGYKLSIFGAPIPYVTYNIKF